MTKPFALVIGDIALDRRSEGTVNKVSRESPVPVLHQTQTIDNLGWAGNVAANIKSLGHDVFLMGTIGTYDLPETIDDAGSKIRDLVFELGIMSHLPGVLGKPTAVKHRFTSNGVIMSRMDTCDAPMSNDKELIAGLNRFVTDDDPKRIKVIVISDNNNGTMTKTLVHAIKAFGAQFRIPIFVDCRHQNADLYQRVDLLKPNMFDSLEMLSDCTHPALSLSEFDPWSVQGAACSEIQKKYKVKRVVVTNGEHGCAYTDAPGNLGVNNIFHYKAFGPSDHSNVRDICGAGDTVIAALAVGHMENKEFAVSVHFAMQCAGYAVQFYGVRAVGRDDVEEFIYKNSAWVKKLMTTDEAVGFVERRRRLNPGARVVLANGCFDGFHAGHLETLIFAKRHGEVLVVAYNDNESLRKLKGTARPHVPDSYRSSHLAMQEPVDAVIRFDGDVETLVRLLNPDFLVKGADARKEYAELPGAAYVRSNGGQVVFCPVDTFYVTIDRPKPDSTSGKSQ